MARSALLNVMTSAALKAGRALSRDFGEVQNLQVSKKGPGDFVSNADKNAEKIIRIELDRARPGYGFLMEESGERQGTNKNHRWIVDPLDGTTNFLHAIPIFAVSIALERDGEIVAGVIYNPAMDELYVAERGTGAYLNDRRLRVANRRELVDCVVGAGIPHIGRKNHTRFLEQQRRFMLETSGIRRMGAAALDLAYVAAGRLDGFWEYGLSPWDVAAGIIIAREAGGMVSDFDSKNQMMENGTICAGNPVIQKKMLSIIKDTDSRDVMAD
ncbi:MAG: inositol monophosphatase family protein [Rhizobiaceae bacterium]